MPASSVVAAATLSLSSVMVPFPMPWDDATPTFTSLAELLPRPAGAQGFVTVKNGHLANDRGRLRFVGMNFTRDAQMPPKADAERIAARLAKFGINAVRLHGFDQPAPRGLLQPDGQSLDPDALDRFHYFVAQLKANGIYAFVSLHAVRDYPGVVTGPGMPLHHNGLDQFHRPMIDSQKAFARELLLARNPYTERRWVDDAALASVEINNENGLSLRWRDGSIDRSPQPYRDELKSLWNRWLAQRYPAPGALERAWGAAADTARAPELVAPASLARRGEGRWALGAQRGARAAVDAVQGPDDAPAVEVAVEATGQRDYDVSLATGGFEIRADESVTLEFDVRADAPRRFGVSLGDRRANRMLVHQWLDAGPLWRHHRLVLTPETGAADAALTFANLATATGRIAFANVRLIRGGSEGLASGDAPGAVELVSRADYARRSARVQADWMAFLGDVERSYFDEMTRFLRQDLRFRGVIVGTQQNYTQVGSQARTDVTDMHAYWDTQKRLDGEWFEMRNRPQTADPNGGLVPVVAAHRIQGKPFIVTEYAVKAGNTYATEADLLMFAYAGFQDWDGVFIFNYSEVPNMRTDRFRGDLGFNGQWNRFVALVPAALMFLRGDVQPARETLVVGVSNETLARKVRVLGHAPQLYALGGLPQLTPLRHGVALAPGAADRLPQPPALGQDAITSDTGELSWDWRDGGLFTVRSPRTQVLSGAIGEQPYRLGEAEIRFGRTRQNWVTATLSDMPAAAGTREWLLTLTGRAENRGMRFSDDGRRFTWGNGPLVIEAGGGGRAGPARVALPARLGSVEVWSLDPRGEPDRRIEVRREADALVFDVLPEIASPWYRIRAVR